MYSSCDRTGFPLVPVQRAGVAVQLLPVTKVQFERFLAEANVFGDTWYEQVLSINPRVSPEHFTAGDRERLFLTGILPEEALAFARWMGDRYDLPSLEEWRQICTALGEKPAFLDRLQSLWWPQAGRPARLVLEGLAAQLRPRSLLDLSLMRGGVVEWVRQGKRWVGLGAPRPAFQPNLWDPLVEEVRAVDLSTRVPFFGFRLVRRG